jgi:hypothetical protein
LRGVDAFRTDIDVSGICVRGVHHVLDHISRVVSRLFGPSLGDRLIETALEREDQANQ